MHDLTEVIFRSIAAFIAVLVITKLIGKSQLGQLTISDYINGIVIGSIAANVAVDLRTNVIHYLTGMVAFGALTIFVQWASLKNRNIRKLLQDEPTIVVHNGKILEHNMKLMRYTMDDLMMQLREKGAFNIADVEFAIAEPNGELSVLLKSTKRPLTPEDLGLDPPYEGIPAELVVDGELIEQNFEQHGISKQWFFHYLKEQGINDIKDIAYAQIDAKGQVYIDLKHDRLTMTVDITDKKPRRKGG
ncbi:DUF421 domain-containing protein [Carboxydothermus ferrireducens]|uniref:Uncharacterized membrane protein YcaP (DUF421 family) n=1 Tax=Carboxydothermus ferrireducens DSM 11255 TaxID=1119529 RepID=A0ABX2R9S4_9THEO|nr:DUF421 domain-containing protein [Carboxydothermus ferrireducens]NYE57684.1 uncharacterized membrane protein YcaP (DUF421 family) [Carboxydothermus ferrireducens DSM 11255]